MASFRSIGIHTKNTCFQELNIFSFLTLWLPSRAICTGVDQDLLWRASQDPGDVPLAKVTSKHLTATQTLFPMHLTIHLPKEILVRLHHVHLTQTHLNSWDSILIFLQLLKKHCDFFFTFVSMTHSKKHILESKSVYSFTCTYKTETSFIKQHFPLIHSIHCDVLFVLFFP